jgi:hypothetical protein
MNDPKARLVPTPEQPMTRADFAQHARIGTLFLVLAISLPIFFIGLLVVLWHLAK